MATQGKPGYGRNARKRADFVAALEQHGRQPATHVAGAARKKDGLASGFHAAFIYARERRTDLQNRHDRRQRA